MNTLLLFFGVTAALAAALANIGLWAPRGIRVKLGGLLAAALFLPFSYMAYSELLSRPKPVGIEWIRAAAPEATVLGSRIVEDEAIHLWLALEGLAEPRAYTLPWNEELARQLHEAQKGIEMTGGTVLMRKPFAQTMDRMDPVFHAQPPEAPPPKQAAVSEGAVVFEGN